MPLMTRRSSTRGLPRVSVGRSGASRENWSSVSQKQSRFIEGLLSETVNHIFEEKGIFMGPEPRRENRHCQSYRRCGLCSGAAHDWYISQKSSRAALEHYRAV